MNPSDWFSQNQSIVLFQYLSLKCLFKFCHWNLVYLLRYALNCVTAGDYQSPLAIAKFIGDLDAGFRLLNLKNDNLRKRFDGLKYDLKKCEEVVYDITLRGLVPRQQQQQPQQQPLSSPTQEKVASDSANSGDVWQLRIRPTPRNLDFSTSSMDWLTIFVSVSPQIWAFFQILDRMDKSLSFPT